MALEGLRDQFPEDLLVREVLAEARALLETIEAAGWAVTAEQALQLNNLVADFRRAKEAANQWGAFIRAVQDYT